jgi:hypothetical protein
MNEQQKHEMILDKTHPSGADEWYCPTCGRRFLFDYEPSFKKTILEAGDEYAIHSGGKGGLRMSAMQVIPIEDTISQEDSIHPIEDPSLAPWSAWLEESDFDSLWNSDVQ